MTYDTWEDIPLTTTWTRAKKRSTYARLLKPGQSFYGPGGFPNVHTVAKIEDVGSDKVFKVTTTNGRVMCFLVNDRVALA